MNSHGHDDVMAICNEDPAVAMGVQTTKMGVYDGTIFVVHVVYATALRAERNDRWSVDGNAQDTGGLCKQPNEFEMTMLVVETEHLHDDPSA